MRDWKVIWIGIALLGVACTEEVVEDEVPQNTIQNVEDVDAELQAILDKIKSDPNNPNFYHELGYYYYLQGDLHNAVNNVYKACAIDTTVGAFYYTLGEIYLDFGIQTGNDELFIDAKLNLDRCLELDSTNFMALTKLGWMECILRNYQEALNYLDDALRSNEYYGEAYFNKGIVFLETGDTVKAASSFQTATEVDANYYDAYIQVGMLYALRPSQHDIAENAYRSAIGIDSSKWEAYYNLGVLLQDQGRGEEAIAVYDLLLTTAEPLFVDAYYNKGWIYLELMDSIDVAMEMFTEAIELAPENHYAFYNRGVCYERMGDYENAAIEFRKALAVQGDYDLAALGLSRVEPYLN